MTEEHEFLWQSSFVVEARFVFGCCAGASGKFEDIALPAIARHHPGVPVLVRRGQRTIAAAYNSILDEAAVRFPGSAVVLLHDDTELLAPDLGVAIDRFADNPSIGVLGCVGGRHRSVMTWWRGERFGRAIDNQGDRDFGGGFHEVDTVDGLLLVLAPDVASVSRFDERRYRGFHGYDADICAQLRAQGRSIVVDDVRVKHHTKVDAYGNFTDFHHAALTWQLKWVSASMGRRAWWRLRRSSLEFRLLGQRLRRATNPVRNRRTFQ